MAQCHSLGCFSARRLDDDDDECSAETFFRVFNVSTACDNASFILFVLAGDFFDFLIFLDNSDKVSSGCSIEPYHKIYKYICIYI